MSKERIRKTRWRLVLGAGAEDCFGGIDAEGAKQERCLGFLYDREYGQKRNVRQTKDKEAGASGNDSRGGLGDTQLQVIDWINEVHELFPKKTIERIEKDALERYELTEMMTNPEILQRAEPSESILKAVLRTKHLMNQDVLSIARVLIDKVVQQLLEKLSQQIIAPFFGVRDRKRRSFLRIANNFDAKETIRRNLKNYDAKEKRLIIDTPFFFSRIRRNVDKWQVIIVVDQSGSMVDSVIHAAVTASIFCGLKALKTHLVAFDTNVINLTSMASNPVETLMSVQLGGGTDIGRALTYVDQLIDNPRRTIVILVSDFFEGAPPQVMMGVIKRMVEGGVRFLGLAALDRDANPSYSHEIAAEMVNLGAHVGAMTPGELALWVAEKIR